MATIERHEEVDASRQRVFELIAGLHGYGRWLPSSGDSRGTSERRYGAESERMLRGRYSFAESVRDGAARS